MAENTFESISDQIYNELDKGNSGYEYSNSEEPKTPKNYKPLLKGILGIALLGAIGYGVYSYYPKLSFLKNVFHTKSDKYIFSVSGSNAMGTTLMPELVKNYLEKKLQASDVEIKLLNKIGTEVEVKGIINSKPVLVYIQSNGSNEGISDLTENICDIAMSTRPLRSDETTSTLNQMPSSQHILGMDGLAAVVNEDNPTADLSLQTLSEIFSGAITNWGMVSRYSGKIDLMGMDENSGSFEYFNDNVLKKNNKSYDAGMTQYKTASELIQAIKDNKRSIGLISSSMMNKVKVLKLKDGNITAILPSTYSISTEDYMMSRYLYLYTQSDNANKFSTDFLQYCLSDMGQEVVKNNGYVSLKPECTKGAEIYSKDTTLNKSYVELFKSNQSCRLSITLKFEDNLNALDSRSKEALDKIVSYHAKLSDKSIVLCGFVANSGNKKFDYTKSKELIDIVQKELSAKGQTTEAIPCGSVVQVANSNGDIPSNKNNRVEVWFR